MDIFEVPRPKVTASSTVHPIVIASTALSGSRLASNARIEEKTRAILIAA